MTMAAKTWAGELGTEKVDTFWFDPDDVVVVTDPSDPSGCYRRSAHHKPREDLIALFGEFGWLDSSMVVLRKDGDKFKVAAGNDRVISLREFNRRAREQGRETQRMLCIRQRGGPDQVTGVIVGENEGRRILDPIERAEGWARYLRTGKSERTAAAMAGMKLKEFQAMMTVLEVSPSARAKIKSRDLAPSAAVTLSRESTELQEAVVTRLPPKAGVREVVAAVKQAKRAKSGDATPIRVAPRTSIVRKLLDAVSSGEAHEIGPRDMLLWVLADERLSPGQQREIDRMLALDVKAKAS
jgi:hypothetical protein